MHSGRQLSFFEPANVLVLHNVVPLFSWPLLEAFFTAEIPRLISLRDEVGALWSGGCGDALPDNVNADRLNRGGDDGTAVAARRGPGRSRRQKPDVTSGKKDRISRIRGRIAGSRHNAERQQAWIGSGGRAKRSVYPVPCHVPGCAGAITSAGSEEPPQLATHGKSGLLAQRRKPPR